MCCNGSDKDEMRRAEEAELVRRPHWSSNEFATEAQADRFF